MGTGRGPYLVLSLQVWYRRKHGHGKRGPFSRTYLVQLVLGDPLRNIDIVHLHLLQYRHLALQTSRQVKASKQRKGILECRPFKSTDRSTETKRTTAQTNRSTINQWINAIKISSKIKKPHQPIKQ